MTNNSARKWAIVGALSAASLSLGLSGCSLDNATTPSEYSVREVSKSTVHLPAIAQQLTFPDHTTMRIGADTSSAQVTTTNVTFPHDVKGDAGHYHTGKDDVLIPVSWSGSFRHRPTIQLVLDMRTITLSDLGPAVVVTVPTEEIGKPLLRVSLDGQTYTLDLTGQPVSN